MARSKQWWWGSLLLLGGAWLSIQQLANLDLWIDEGWSVAAAQQPTWGAFGDFLIADVHPPLYFLLLRGWLPLAGESLFAMRWLAWGATLISLALTYRLGTKLFDSRTALAGMVILASSDLLLALAPEVRHYPLYMLLASLSSICYWRYQKSWQKPWGVAYVITAMALLYTLYWGVFILIAHGCHWIIIHRRQWRQGVWIPPLMVLLYLPWLPALLAQFTSDANPLDAQGYQNALAVNRQGMAIILFQLFGLPEALFIGLVVGGMVGSYASSRYRPSSQSLFLGLWLFIPIVLAILSALANYSLMTHRPMLALLPPMALLCGHTLSQLPRWGYTLLLGIILVNNLTTTGATAPPRAPWSEVSAYLANHTSPQDTIFLATGLNGYALQHHLKLADAPNKTILLEYQRRNDDSIILQSLENTQVIWLVEFLRDQEWRPTLAAFGFQPTTPTINLAYFLVDDIRVTRYAKPSTFMPNYTFGEALALQTNEVFQREGRLAVNLTWQPLSFLSIDYTMSVFLLDANGQLVAQHDSPPLDGTSPTTTWTTDHIYFDRHTLDIHHLPRGVYQVGIKVYWWEAGTITNLRVRECACEVALVGEVVLP